MNKQKINFITKAQAIHGSIYDYSKVQYKNINTKVEIICKEHGSFIQSPRLHLYKKCGCNVCAVERSKETNTKTTEEFVADAKTVHNGRYDYSCVNYINAYTPIQITCKEHGIFNQVPSTHLRGSGCIACARRDTKDDFIMKANNIHQNLYNYDKVKYVGSTSKVSILCDKHGYFSQAPESHLQGIGCPVCGATKSRGITSQAERDIQQLFRDNNIDIISGDRSILTPLELDIYIPTLNVAIEYNGIFWHSELMGKDNKYHLNKTKLCSDQNIRLIHIFESEWIHKQNIVRSRLGTVMGANRRIYARKCDIRLVSSVQSKEFLETSHIQGHCQSNVKLGLFHDGELVSLMTFGKPRFNKKVEWELLRFCNTLNTTVVGGASRLFKYFITNHAPSSIISYSDRRWNNGGLYNMLGFIFSHSSAPNYFYFMKNSSVLESRHKYQKHKLKNKLASFDPSLTEWENMKNNGYNRVWDCGNDVFIWSDQINSSI